MAGALEKLPQSLMGKGTAICKMTTQDKGQDGKGVGFGKTGLLKGRFGNASRFFPGQL